MTTLEQCTLLVSSLLVTTDVAIVTVAPMARLPVIIHHVVSVDCVSIKKTILSLRDTYSVRSSRSNVCSIYFYN